MVTKLTEKFVAALRSVGAMSLGLVMKNRRYIRPKQSPTAYEGGHLKFRLIGVKIM